MFLFIFFSKFGSLLLFDEYKVKVWFVKVVKKFVEGDVFIVGDYGLVSVV